MTARLQILSCKQHQCISQKFLFKSGRIFIRYYFSVAEHLFVNEYVIMIFQCMFYINMQTSYSFEWSGFNQDREFTVIVISQLFNFPSSECSKLKVKKESTIIYIHFNNVLQIVCICVCQVSNVLKSIFQAQFKRRL